MDFFISYTGVDKSWAEWIAWELEKETFECVLQAWDFVAGEDFMQEMQKAATESKRTIAVLSPEYLQSRYATIEMNAALVGDPLGDGRKLVPIRVRECKPAGLLSGRIYIDLVGLAESDARTALLDGVRASLLGRVKPPEAPQFPGVPRFPGSEVPETPVPPAARPGVQVPTPAGPALQSEKRSKSARASRSRAADTRTGKNSVAILFLGSAAGIALDLKGELQQIERALATSAGKERFAVKSAFDVRAEDLFAQLNEHNADVFHFSGSMTEGDVLLHAEGGGVRTVSQSALVGLVRSAGKSMRLAVLNACNSLGCAEALADVVGCAIGVRADITDPEAILYSKTFYGALGYGRNVQECHEQAILALQMEGAPREHWPELRVAANVQASAVRF
jgi:hypothetical protein